MNVLRVNQLRIRALVLFAAISIAEFACWNFLDIILNNNPQVVRELVPYFDPLRNLLLVSNELGKNFIPGHFFIGARVALVIGLIGLIIRAVIKEGRQVPLLIILLMAFGVYLLVWLVIPAHEENISRFMAVILPVFYFLILYAGQSKSWSSSPIVRLALLELVILFLSYNLGRMLINSFNWGEIYLINLTFCIR